MIEAHAIGVSGKSYPCLRQSKNSAMVVLFSNANCGVVVSPASDWVLDFQIGYTNEGWNEKDFENFNGTIQLKNKY